MSTVIKTKHFDAVKAKTPFTVSMVDLKAQCSLISEEIDKELKEVLTNCDFILGSKVRAFEQAYAGFCNVRYAVGTASGTDAILLSLKALDIGEGDEVITQANTFIATLLAISNAGARPVLVDIDPATYNMDPSKLKEKITERTKAVVPVHMYGRASDMDSIMEIATQNSIAVVEDACQSHGAWHYGRNSKRRTGSIGDASAFSFYPGKNLGAFGDGGIVTTDSEELCRKLRMLRDYGQTRKYHHVIKGLNSRLDTIQAAILLVKLHYLDGWNILRVSHARKYEKLLSGIPEIELPEINGDLSHVFHIFVVMVEQREKLIEYLKERSISTGIHYPIPNHLQEAFRDLGYKKGDFPITEKYAEKILSLPMYPELTDERIEYVAGAIREFYGR